MRHVIFIIMFGLYHNNYRAYDDIMFTVTVPDNLSINNVITTSVNNGDLKYFRLPFPTTGITLTLSVSTGNVICYASDIVQNPNANQGYEWRVETSGSVEVFIDPDLLDRDPGTYIYIGIEGDSSSNQFSLNSTSGDRRSECQHNFIYDAHELSMNIGLAWMKLSLQSCNADCSEWNIHRFGGKWRTLVFPVPFP